MKTKEQRVLDDLKRLIDEVAIDESILEYGATYVPATGNVEYFIKLKNSDEHIAESKTYLDLDLDRLPYDHYKALKRILKDIKMSLPYSDYVNLNAIRIYSKPGSFTWGILTSFSSHLLKNWH